MNTKSFYVHVIMCTLQTTCITPVNMKYALEHLHSGCRGNWMFASCSQRGR